MKEILCYGDSNTWGAIPGTLKRFPREIRWTGVMARELGADYHVQEDGINGRRTSWDDPENPCRNGMDALGYALYRAKPLDLVILMLGTNDLHHTDAKGYYEGLSMLSRRILQANTYYPGSSKVFPRESQEAYRLLLVSPIVLCKDMPGYEESLRFPEYTERLARELKIPWLNAAKYAGPSSKDGCHMEAEDHLRLGMAFADKVREIL